MASREKTLAGSSRRIGLKLGIAAGAMVAAVTVAYFLSERGPRRVGETDTDAGPASGARSEAVELLRSESLEMEQQFDEEVATEDVPTLAQLKLLEDALHAQKDFLRLESRPSAPDVERARSLEVKLAGSRARMMFAESMRLEKAAAEYQAANDGEAATVALREALRLQKEINTGGADASLRRAGREAALELQIESIDAEPVARDVDRLEGEARAALVAKDAALAGGLFAAAADAQRRINHDFSRTRFASPARLERLETEIASIGAIGLADERDRFTDEAAARDAAGAADNAAALFARARDVQERINREFPQSRFASQPRREELEAARQTALSRPQVVALAGLDAQIDAALRARRVADAQLAIAKAATAAAALEKSLPLSRLIDAGRRARLELLVRVSPQLDALHAAVLDHVRTVPGMKVSMLETEVSQKLYVALMAANPSRVAGEELPVESMTAVEAEEFCRRLSSIMARTVRLPTRAEFGAALGPEGSGNASTSAGVAGAPRRVDDGAVNAAGFCHLGDNVAEWVSGDSPGEVLIAGGSYDDAAAAGGVNAFRVSSRTERFRTVGFRIMVE